MAAACEFDDQIQGFDQIGRVRNNSNYDSPSLRSRGSSLRPLKQQSGSESGVALGQQSGWGGCCICLLATIIMVLLCVIASGAVYFWQVEGKSELMKQISAQRQEIERLKEQISRNILTAQQPEIED